MLKPAGKRVLVKRREVEEVVTEGGLVVPSLAISRPNDGEVRAVGSEVTLYKPGDRVLFPGYVGEPVEVDGIILEVMNEEDITGTLE